jgi:hypothetical protein
MKPAPLNARYLTNEYRREGTLDSFCVDSSSSSVYLEPVFMSNSGCLPKLPGIQVRGLGNNAEVILHSQMHLMDSSLQRWIDEKE